MSKSLDVTKDNVVNIFFRYTIPTMIGMWAISLASIVDGIFVGRFIGPDALAVINLVIPYVSLLLGIITMLGAGGCVLSGKRIGEKNKEEASYVFSKIIQIMVVISVIAAVIILVFPYPIAKILGANNPDVIRYTVTYITIYSYFLPLQLLGIGMSFFARVNGRPGLASFALLFGAILNIALDWVFVVYMNLGMGGAALATGISQSMTFFILIPSFLSHKSNLKFVVPKKISKDILFSIYNGTSEFLNETSSGIVAFVFNHVLIQQSGIKGVAAFTIVNYFLYSGCLIAYSVVASIHGPVSINFGAGHLKRARAFLKTAVIFNFCLGSVIAISLRLFDTSLVRFFLKSSSESIAELATLYIGIMWSAFFISGINIVLSGYFTSIQKPVRSFIFSALRSFVLPVGLILSIHYLFMDKTVFLSIPIAEAITLIALIIYTRLGRRNLG